MREKTIEKALVDRVESLGGIAYKFSSPARRGVPDRLVVMPNGFVVFVECKTAKGKLSRLQMVELDRLRRLDARVEVVYTLDDVRRLCVELGGAK